MELPATALSSTAWTPLLRGARQRRALEVVEKIADELQARYAVPETATGSGGWSIAAGRSGGAIFFAYLGDALADAGARATAVRLVEESIEAAAGALKSVSLFSGFTGVAWTLAHLDGWLVDLSDGDPLEAVDAALAEVLASSPWVGQYDLLDGLVGIGVYALERLPRPTAIECLAKVVARLSELARRSDRGASWWTPPAELAPRIRRQFPGGAYNLGLAHGVPGVIALLGKAAGVEQACSTTRPLLDDAVAWLLAQRLPADAGADFASFGAPDVVAPPARSAWCYGDPGAASALRLAAQAVGSPTWEAEALTIARRAASRPPANCGVVDPGLCHGAAGLAHIFNRLHQTTGEAVFGDTALLWLQRVFDHPRPGTGFLEGAAGIGLALLAAATPTEPRWDRLLLLS